MHTIKQQHPTDVNCKHDHGDSERNNDGDVMTWRMMDENKETL